MSSLPGPSGDRRSVAVHLDGPLNFRDLGGYPSRAGGYVRTGVVYRSDDLAGLSDEDLERLHPLALRTVLDLRSRDEVARRGRFPVERYDPRTHYRHLGLVEDVIGSRARGQDDRAYVLARYRHLLVGGAPSIREAFGVFANEASYPLVFHCVAGKDRTGVVAALLLGVLNVPDEFIVEDYHRSDRATQAWFARQRDLGEDPEHVLSGVPPVLFRAEPSTMWGLLSAVRAEHGSIEGYLRAIGVTDAELKRIPDLLLAEDPDVTDDGEPG